MYEQQALQLRLTSDLFVHTIFMHFPCSVASPYGKPAIIVTTLTLELELWKGADSIYDGSSCISPDSLCH